MRCEEFQRILPEIEGSHSPEQREHLKKCSCCGDLVSDLNAIAQQAALLAEDEEPSPRVWNSLEIALRQEGLIRSPRQATAGAERGFRWNPRWVVPLAACCLTIFGLLLYERGGIPTQTSRPIPGNTNMQAEVMPADQAELLRIVAVQAPTLRASYESQLKAVNAYIRDAELSARRNPNDEISQQYLANAYEQRTMVYEMAMDRGLP